MKLLLLLTSLKLCYLCYGTPNGEKSKLFCPGLKPDEIILPCRYYTVEVKDDNGNM